MAGLEDLYLTGDWVGMEGFLMDESWRADANPRYVLRD